MIFSSLLLLFIVVPLVELSLLLKLGDIMGWWATLLLVVATGVIGAALARWQGLQVLLAVRRDTAAGRLPAPRLMDGLLILIAGVLLVTPGLLTDAVGFLLLMPPVRAWLRERVRRRLLRRRDQGVIEVEYHEW